MADISGIRSLLFAPASDERKLLGAFRSDADAVIADLEDGVARGEKEAARKLAARVLSSVESGCARMVRVNAGERRDLEVVAALDLDAVVLPKATPKSVAALGPEGPPVIALIETAEGLRSAFAVAAAPRVCALLLGALDLATELRLERRDDGLELLLARSRVVLDSAAARVRPPFDGVYPHVRDEAGLEAEIALAHSLGFAGKACVHPAQLAPVNRGFGVTPEQLAWARSALKAYRHAAAEGRGVAVLDGEMIDLPVVKRAQALLEQAERSG